MMISAEQFEHDFGPEPVFDEPVLPDDAPDWLLQSYQDLQVTFEAMHDKWCALRHKYVRLN
jgi:hypothetical protein